MTQNKVKIKLEDGSICIPTAYVVEEADKTEEFESFIEAQSYLDECNDNKLITFLNDYTDLTTRETDTFVSSFKSLGETSRKKLIELLQNV